MNNINLKSKLKLSTKSYLEFYNKMVPELKAELEPKVESLLYRKFSSGNSTVPLTKDSIYFRAAAIIRKLTENPQGIKKISKTFSRKKNRGVKPSKVVNSSRNLIRKLTRILLDHGYLCRHLKGLYTSTKGKDLLIKNL